MVKFFKLCRAREEITRLNVEIRRVRTRIHDDTLHTEQILEGIAISNPPLYAALQRWWTPRAAINNKLIRQLDEIERRKDFTGRRGIGVHLGSSRLAGLRGAISDAGEALASVEDSSGNDEHARDLENLADFMERITD
jgi:hypothetical protein